MSPASNTRPSNITTTKEEKHTTASTNQVSRAVPSCLCLEAPSTAWHVASATDPHEIALVLMCSYGVFSLVVQVDTPKALATSPVAVKSSNNTNNENNLIKEDGKASAATTPVRASP